MNDFIRSVALARNITIISAIVDFSILIYVIYTIIKTRTEVNELKNEIMNLKKDSYILVKKKYLKRNLPKKRQN